MSGPEQAEASTPRTGLSGGLLSGLFVLVVAVGALVAWLFNDDAAVAEVGRPAPALAITTFDGEVFDLVEHVRADRGPVLVNLWASWCEPCKREFPVLSDFALANPDVTVVGVAVQDQLEDAQAFAEENQPDFLVGWDRDNEVRDSYPSFGLPATFVIARDGTVVDIIFAELTPERMHQISFEG